MRQAVVYYSMSGCTEFVAKIVAEHLGCDIIKIEPKKPYTMGSAFSKGVMASRKGEGPELKEPVDISGYDRIWLGAPAWGFTYAAPLNSVIDTNDFTGKQVVFFNTNGRGIGKAADKLKAKLADAKVIATVGFNGKKILSDTEKVLDWVQSVED